MKSVISIIISVFAINYAIAQKAAYPTKEVVLKDLKTMQALEPISRIYGSPITWDKLKLEYNQFVNGGQRMESNYRDYQSSLAKKNRLDYDDMSDVRIIATTPKNSEGKYFEIIVVVSYTRYGGTMPANKWTFKESNVDTKDYYEFGGSYVADKKKVDELIPVLKNYKGETNTAEKPVNYSFKFWENDEMDIVTIDSIYINKKISDENLTTQRFKHFLIACTFIKLDVANVYYPGSTAELKVEYDLDETTKKWNIAEMSVNEIAVNQTKKTTKLEATDTPDKSYKRLIKNGFNDVYKTKSTVTRSLYTENEVKKFSDQIISAINLTYQKPEDGSVAIENLIDPTLPNAKEITASYYTTITNAKKYMCELKEAYINLNTWKEEQGGKQKIVIGSETLVVQFYREGEENNKELIKKYKDAGVSKETIKSTFGGKYDEAWKTELGIIFKNNRWYITTKATDASKMD